MRARLVRHVTGIVVVALAVGGVFASPGFADGNGAQTMTFHSNVVLPNPCNGDVIQSSVTLHESSRISQSSGGTFHFSFHSSLNFSGIGQDGTKYTGSDEIEETFVMSAGQVENQVRSFKVISAGSDPNFVMHEIGHLTINANGTITSDIASVSSDCRG